MKPEIALSIVVPMFNSADSILACLGSILRIAPASVQVILVDDGSTDNGPALVQQCFALALESGQLRLLRQRNAGVSAARNAGLDLATGRYIGFVDADDILDPAYFTTLLSAIEQSRADIIQFGFRNWDGKGALTEAREVKPGFAGTYDASAMQLPMFGSGYWYPWNKVFARWHFNATRFPLGARFCEDMMTISELWRNAKTIQYLDTPLYFYRANPNGATANAKPEYVEQLTQFYRTLMHRKDDCTVLLKMSIQFCIYSCQHAMGVPYALAPDVAADVRPLRWRVDLWRHLESRSLRILLLPRLNRWFAKFRGQVGH